MTLVNGMKRTKDLKLFDMLNGQIELGQNVRVFPISNWTELDVWSYIQKESIEIPSIYFAPQA